MKGSTLKACHIARVQKLAKVGILSAAGTLRYQEERCSVGSKFTARGSKFVSPRTACAIQYRGL